MTDDDDPMAPRLLTRRRRDGSEYTVMWTHPDWYGDVYRLWRLGLNDGEISRTLQNKTPNAVWIARTGMGLRANARAGERTFPDVAATEPGRP